MAEYRDRSVTVTVCRKERRLVISIKDEGEGFDWRTLPDPADTPDLLSIHGRGVLLSRMSVDGLAFNEQGNEVTVEKLF